MKRDKHAMYALMIPWLFIIGMCGVMIIAVILDFIFDIGLSRQKKGAKLIAPSLIVNNQ